MRIPSNADPPSFSLIFSSFRAISFEFRTRVPFSGAVYPYYIIPFRYVIRNSILFILETREEGQLGTTSRRGDPFPAGSLATSSQGGVGGLEENSWRRFPYHDPPRVSRGNREEGTKAKRNAGSSNFIKAPSSSPLPDISNKTSIAENRVTSSSHKGRLFRELFPTWRALPRETLRTGHFRKCAGRERGQLLTSLDFILPSPFFNFPRELNVKMFAFV